ncbi:DUF5708 family protein [Streptomyces sp. P9(2023)]|uniref:DUF5708 family protein n=1 Tax=Streptomyces sp. P9(2023) TaxID=3064394 RepID=UPI0028F433DF|nr:DUF5708 family protein [Streptomyces sp. P9(2023)]MDT9692113.1 DUF5708 family protein [Streptomyces sp. P9(2023)]
MASPTKNFAEGAVMFGIGLALRLFTEDVDIPVFTLTKVGVVLMVIGGIEILYGVYRTVSSRSDKASS